MMPSSLFILLLKPSLFSSLIIIVITLAVIGGLNWPFFTYNPVAYDYLYGDFGVITALEQMPSFQNLLETVSDNPIVYGVGVVVLAAAAGWAAFISVRTLKNSILSVKSLSDPFERRQTLRRIATRAGFLALWAIYMLISTTIIFPACLLVARMGAEHILSIMGSAFMLGAALAFALTLHLHIVCLRLVLMRPRVFGGKAAIQDVLFYHQR